MRSWNFVWLLVPRTLCAVFPALGIDCVPWLRCTSFCGLVSSRDFLFVAFLNFFDLASWVKFSLPLSVGSGSCGTSEDATVTRTLSKELASRQWHSTECWKRRGHLVMDFKENLKGSNHAVAPFLFFGTFSLVSFTLPLECFAWLLLLGLIKCNFTSYVKDTHTTHNTFKLFHRQRLHGLLPRHLNFIDCTWCHLAGRFPSVRQ